MSLKFHRWLHRNGLSRKRIRHNWFGRIFGEWLLSREYWVPCPQAFSRGWLIGCLSAASPFMGLQIVMALPFAFYFRANIPIILLLILTTNPLTYPFYILFAYWVGSSLLGTPSFHPPQDTVNEVAQASLWDLMNWSNLSDYFFILLFGCLVVGISTGLIGSFLIPWLWPSSQRKSKS